MEKKIWIGLSILSILLMGISYAWWYWNSYDNTNVSLTINGVNVTYIGGDDITGVNLIPVSSKEIGIRNNTAIEKVVSVSSDSNIDNFNLYLEIITLDDGLKDESFVYEVYRGANLVGIGNFKEYEQKDKISLATFQKVTSTTSTYQIYIYIDGNQDNPSTMMNQSFNFKLLAEATDEDPAKKTLTKLGVTNVKNITPDFSKLPYMSKEKAIDNLTYVCENLYNQTDLSTCLSNYYNISTTDEWIDTYVSKIDDNGVIETIDDLGTSYYYRGDVENNYVYFAGFYWRILRINGDGTIRIIYDGNTLKHNGEMGEDNIAFTSQYNSSFDNNAYVGYMYGNTGSKSYNKTHMNKFYLDLKVDIDNWYIRHILFENRSESGIFPIVDVRLYVSKYIADAIYCNDRKVVTVTFLGQSYTGDGVGTNVTAYAPTQRILTYSPTLICSQENDKFSVTSIGNGDLIYPIATLTIDEAIMGGITLGDVENIRLMFNKYSYLSMSENYWTLSSYNFDDNCAENWFVFGGGVSYDGVNNFFGVRPVISLKADVPLTGTGDYDSPFIVGNTTT